jgi:hypothetical protein
MVLRIRLVPRLWRANASPREISSLELLAGRWVHASTFAVRNGAVVGGASAVFDGGAGELGRYAFVDTGIVGCFVRISIASV